MHQMELKQLGAAPSLHQSWIPIRCRRRRRKAKTHHLQSRFHQHAATAAGGIRLLGFLNILENYGAIGNRSGLLTRPCLDVHHLSRPPKASRIIQRRGAR